jgi:hypothetical protein
VLHKVYLNAPAIITVAITNCVTVITLRSVSPFAACLKFPFKAVIGEKADNTNAGYKPVNNDDAKTNPQITMKLRDELRKEILICSRLFKNGSIINVNAMAIARAIKVTKNTTRIKIALPGLIG